MIRCEFRHVASGFQALFRLSVGRFHCARFLVRRSNCPYVQRRASPQPSRPVLPRSHGSTAVSLLEHGHKYPALPDRCKVTARGDIASHRDILLWHDTYVIWAHRIFRWDQRSKKFHRSAVFLRAKWAESCGKWASNGHYRKRAESLYPLWFKCRVFFTQARSCVFLIPWL